MNLKMPAETILFEESFDRKTGKQLESLAFGETRFGNNDEITRLNKSTHRRIKSVAEMVWDTLDKSPSPESKPILTKEDFVDFIEGCAVNPFRLKVGMSNLTEKIKKLNEEFKNPQGRDSLAITKELKIKRRTQDIFNTFVNAIKGNLSETNEKMLDEICVVMSNIQEAEPVKTDFSRGLMGYLEKELSRSGIEVRKLQFVTTLVEGDDQLSWPDFFGVDAFINYDLVIKGEEKSGRILIDGTKNPEKAINNDFTNYGTGGFLHSKLILPFMKLHTKEDIDPFAKETARYIQREVVPKI